MYRGKQGYIRWTSQSGNSGSHDQVRMHHINLMATNVFAKLHHATNGIFFRSEIKLAHYAIGWKFFLQGIGASQVYDVVCILW